MYFAGQQTNFISNRGRPSLMKNEEIKELVFIYYTKQYSIRKLAEIFGVSKTTIVRTLKTAASRWYE